VCVCVQDDYTSVGLYAGILLNVIWRTRGERAIVPYRRTDNGSGPTEWISIQPSTNAHWKVSMTKQLLYYIYILDISVPCVPYKIFGVWDFGRCKTMSAKESKWRRVGGRFHWNQPLPPLHHYHHHHTLSLYNSHSRR